MLLEQVNDIGLISPSVRPTERGAIKIASAGVAIYYSKSPNEHLSITLLILKFAIQYFFT